jgi:tetratricopeptide (TPR) repeat protein
VPRPERPLDPEAAPLQRFAFELRQLRRRAGGPTYRELARRANYSATVLAEAAGGVRLPTLAATLAYVAACGGDRPDWERRWRAVAAVATASGGGAGPAELPATLDTFTGRDGELARLLAWLDRPVAAPRIAVVHGIAGVGKTALAVRGAHRVANRFPDGQLFAGLHGYADGLAPRDPCDVLGGFLRGLGLREQGIPAAVEEAAARYRSLVAQRRVLVVLDNARDSAQVRPLLPGSPSCAVLITSRAPLLDLDGAQRLHLGVLGPPEAVALLGKLAGRAAAEPEAARRVAHACGHLPLALRIAGARLAARPALSVVELADRLARPQRRLDELRLGDLAVRTSFELSYGNLASGCRRAYRMLAMLDGSDFGLAVAAAQLDLPERAADEALDRLIGEHLVEEPAAGRYRFHDLLRLFGRELAAQVETDAERDAALGRVLRRYAAAAGDDRAALDWLDAELAGILAAAHRAETRPAETAALVPELAIALYPYFQVRPHWRDWEALDRLALGVARRLGDRASEARLLGQLGVVCRKLFRINEAVAAAADGLRIHQALGDRASEAAAWNTLGNAHFDQRRYDDGIACLRRSLELRRDTHHRAGEAVALANLANILKRTGCVEEALDCGAQSLAIWRELGNRHREAIVLCGLGETLVEAGRLDQALDCYQQGHRIACEFGDRHGEAYTLVAIGEAHRRAGRLDAALAAGERGLALNREIGDRWGEGDALRRLGQARRDLGDRRRALARWQEALRCFEEVDAPDSADVLAELRALEGS